MRQIPVSLHRTMHLAQSPRKKSNCTVWEESLFEKAKHDEMFQARRDVVRDRRGRGASSTSVRSKERLTLSGACSLFTRSE